MITIKHELPGLEPAIETLLDRAFGPGRTVKTSYRYRDGVAPLPHLCFTAFRDGSLAGTVRHWPIALANCPLDVVLLGPIAVDPMLQVGGIGAHLMQQAINEATNAGHDMILLVGAPAYYRRFGFRPAAEFGIVMPDEQAERVQALPLSTRAVQEKAGGLILPRRDLVLPARVRRSAGPLIIPASAFLAA